ncbi:hypothetical protein [Sphingomonas pollutisoli]|uniref:hypothetical protein n=1 Tax=Sphingomonas pollutisoli TaxID=3030829 RepID=UPI003B831E00
MSDPGRLRGTTTRVSSALNVGTSHRGSDVVGTLDRIAAVHGRPKRIRLDNGPKLISSNLDLWAYQHDVVLGFSRPGKPTTMRPPRRSTAVCGPNAATPTGS